MELQVFIHINIVFYMIPGHGLGIKFCVVGQLANTFYVFCKQINLASAPAVCSINIKIITLVTSYIFLINSCIASFDNSELITWICKLFSRGLTSI